MNPESLDDKLERISRQGNTAVSDDEMSDQNGRTEDGEISEDSSESASGKSDYTISDRELDQDDRDFEAGQVLGLKLPSTASKADKQRRADWARNLDYTMEKIDKFEKAIKKVRREASKHRKKLSKTLKQLGKLKPREHYPGNYQG